MNNLQLVSIALGAIFAVCGIVFFAMGKGAIGDNTIKILGFEFKLTNSALVIFTLGVVLIIAGLNIKGPVTPPPPPPKSLAEQITEAAEPLSKPGDAQSHITAILALETLYKQAGDEHWRVVEHLVSFIRTNAKWKTAASRPAKDMPQDVNMALRVLARRTRKFKDGETEKIDLSGLDLRGANLRFDGDTGANFKGIRLIGAHLDHAQLQFADLEEAILMNADLDDANLYKANLYDADLQDVSIKGADLQQAIGGCRENVVKYTSNLDLRTKLSPC